MAHARWAALAFVVLVPGICLAQKSVQDCETELGEAASQDRAAVAKCVLDAASPSAPEVIAPPAKKEPPFKSDPASARRTMANGRAAVLHALKDADSAKFRNLYTTKDVMLCGEVNAKNSYGGYTGFTRFVSVAGANVSLDDGGDSFANWWKIACQR